jgi:hypothetical protein
MPDCKKEKDKIYPETPHLILCEGVDAHRFFIWLLEFLIKSEQIFEKFKVYDFGGICELRKYLENLSKTEDFKKIVRSLCIIRDAEKDATGACQSIEKALQDCGFANSASPYVKASDPLSKYPQIATGFILFPSCSKTLENGTLEDLCLKILAKDNAKSILQNAEKALEPYLTQLQHPHKNHLHTYFSMTNEFVSLKIGEAAKANAFRWNSPEINSLKSFLLQMAGV